MCLGVIDIWTLVTENTSLCQAFESSVPSQNWSYSPLCLAWDCLKSSISETDSELDIDSNKDYFTDNNWDKQDGTKSWGNSVEGGSKKESLGKQCTVQYRY